MKILKDKFRCPICHQGWVEPIRIKNLDVIAYLCDESEELWLTDGEIQPEAYIGLYTFLEARFGTCDYSQIEYLGKKSS